jgi:methionyl aminopeptidase
MIHYRSEEEIELLRRSSLLVGKTLAEVAGMLKSGITTQSIDIIAEEYILDNGAVPGFKNYNGYPATLCISVNEEVVHGIPGKKILKDGDIVSVDCGTIMNGYYGDSAYTFVIGETDEARMQLLRITKESLYKGIEAAKAGNRVGDIGNAIQRHVEQYKYTVVRDLVGHGLGTNLHEEPQVPNYGKRGSGVKLGEGMVICIEPMINLGRKEVVQAADGWTIRTADRQPSAHFEHTVAIMKGRTEILSTFELIEKVNNSNIKVVF